MQQVAVKMSDMPNFQFLSVRSLCIYLQHVLFIPAIQIEGHVSAGYLYAFKWKIYHICQYKGEHIGRIIHQNFQMHLHP